MMKLLKALIFTGICLTGNLYAAGLQKVEVQVDNEPFIAATGLETWTTRFDTTQLENGSHMIMAKATDLSSNVSDIRMTTIRVNNLSSLSLIPSGLDVPMGDMFKMEIRMDSPIKLNAAQAVLSFPPGLQAMEIDYTGSAFPVIAPSVMEPGRVVISAGSINPVTGNQRIAIVTFKTMATGTANINFLSDGSNNGSLLLRVTNSNNVLTSVNGAVVNVLEITDTTKPTIEIVEPLENEEVSGTIDISGIAEDK